MEKGLPTIGVKVDARLEDTAIDGEVFLFLHGEEGPKECTQTSFPRRKRRLIFTELCPRARPILHIQLISMTQGDHCAQFHKNQDLCSPFTKGLPQHQDY